MAAAAPLLRNGSTREPHGGWRADLPSLTLAQAAHLLRTGEVSAEYYARVLLQRCEQHVALNAFITIDPSAVLVAAHRADAARAAGAAPGPLHGVPIAIKDNINTSDLPTSGGTAALRGHRTRADAVVVTHLRQAGALVLGKTNLHELAMGWTGNNAAFGRTDNPHASGHITGGSSGGSAAAVAAGLAPAAIGTDTNGSIRIPAAFCGIAGFRPSVGRYPLDGVVPLSPVLDTVGPMARTVEDIVLLDAVMRGATPPPHDAARPSLHGVRIGIVPDIHPAGLSAEVAAVFAACCDRLAGHGAVLVRFGMPELAALVDGVAPALIRHDAAQALPAYLAEYAPEVSMAALVAAAQRDLHLQTLGQDAAASEAYAQALDRRAQLRVARHAQMARHGLSALLHPVVPMAAPLADPTPISPAPDVVIDGRVVAARDAFGRPVASAGLTGTPVLVLPGGATPSGLPVGLALEGEAGGDDTLLQLSRAVEAVLGA
ncbi:Asp-tRNA(Asn)/Glu-tRNA(Gln) amidotransferase A subunit family amidase [Bradyrhizobium sp. USDA 4463]